MPRLAATPLLALLSVLTAGPWTPDALAARGAAELSLDRPTTTALIAATVAGELRLELPPLGTVVVQVDPPRSVTFRDGGIETTLAVRLVDPAFETGLDVRLVPVVDELTGEIRLECVEAHPSPGSVLPIELAALVRPMALPRRIAWTIEIERNVTLWADCYVQGIEIADDRLVLRLGLALERRAEPAEVSARDRRPVSSAAPVR